MFPSFMKAAKRNGQESLRTAGRAVKKLSEQKIGKRVLNQVLDKRKIGGGNGGDGTTLRLPALFVQERNAEIRLRSCRESFFFPRENSIRSQCANHKTKE